MLNYIIRRILYSIPVIFGVALIVFTLFNLVGGDPTIQMLGKHANGAQIEALRHELGFDQPLYMQFIDYLKQIITFDYGRRYATKQYISDMISSGIGPSTTLAATGFTLELVISLSFALLVAYYRGKFTDRFISLLCIMGMSIPALAVILFGQYFLAYQ